jgi:ring-1,2-phenylacetyl-CoA epoxidase subunit PaaE
MTATDSPPTTRRHHAVFHPLRVGAVERITDDAVVVTFDVPEELREDYRFVAGQHLTLRAEIDSEEVRRNYSICAPATTGPLRIAIKRLEGGIFSGYATRGLKVGDVVDVMTPTGRFCVPVDPAHAKHYAAVAAGSGITPVISIVSTVLEVEPASRVTLIYGNRTSSTVMFLEELEDLKNRYPTRLQLLHVLSREQQEVELLNGRIDRDKLADLLATLVPPGTVDEWLLCGPYAMVEQAREVLLGSGVPAGHVHTELFHVEPEPPRERVVAPGAAPDADASTVTVWLDGRASTFDLVPGGSSILDATLAVRRDAPYACKGGVCGTCRAKVVEGSVTMTRNYALEQDEIEGGFVLACQSRPATPSVTLDFDA